MGLKALIEGLRGRRRALERIAEALERAYPAPSTGPRPGPAGPEALTSLSNASLWEMEQESLRKALREEGDLP
jgi:hypothetical protein